jgi:hypothetical protein
MLVRIDEQRSLESRFADKEIARSYDHLIPGVVDLHDLEGQFVHWEQIVNSAVNSEVPQERMRETAAAAVERMLRPQLLPTVAWPLSASRRQCARPLPPLEYRHEV